MTTIKEFEDELERVRKERDEMKEKVEELKDTQHRLVLLLHEVMNNRDELRKLIGDIRGLTKGIGGT